MPQPNTFLKDWVEWAEDALITIKGELQEFEHLMVEHEDQIIQLKNSVKDDLDGLKESLATILGKFENLVKSDLDDSGE